MTDNIEEIAEAFRFLDVLRESGQCNMFGASKYLKEMYDISNKESRDITALWMQTFDGETPASERAAIAIAKKNNG